MIDLTKSKIGAIYNHKKNNKMIGTTVEQGKNL